MASTQPARGMRDFLPADVRKREYVIGIIKQVYESYGFEPLETPAVENIDTLMGKYGDEGNQLIFKILKRGEKLVESLESGVGGETPDRLPTPDSRLSDLALRYDLTVPLARVVANNRNELPKFFKRYQIQPVWRADRPARGRFREFYQCDVDAIGSESMLVEAEISGASSTILERLGFRDYTIRINHRVILTGLLETSLVHPDFQTGVLVAIDKLDKIGVDGVMRELSALHLHPDCESRLRQFLEELPTINADQTLQALARFIGPHDGAQRAISDIRQLQQLTSGSNVVVDVSLARGLSYYTGPIMEINIPNFAGSLGGGGRYDGLIGMFGKEQIPACGFSLGLERILVVMDERGMFPPEIAESAPADVLVTIWSDETAAESLKLAQELRAGGLRVTLYPEPDKLGKQIKYADSIRVPFVAVLGESEIADGTVTVKNMKTGEQQTVARSEAGALIA